MEFIISNSRTQKCLCRTGFWSLRSHFYASTCLQHYSIQWRWKSVSEEHPQNTCRDSRLPHSEGKLRFPINSHTEMPSSASNQNSAPVHSNSHASAASVNPLNDSASASAALATNEKTRNPTPANSSSNTFSSAPGNVAQDSAITGQTYLGARTQPSIYSAQILSLKAINANKKWIDSNKFLHISFSIFPLSSTLLLAIDFYPLILIIGCRFLVTSNKISTHNTPSTLFSSHPLSEIPHPTTLPINHAPMRQLNSNTGLKTTPNPSCASLPTKTTSHLRLSSSSSLFFALSKNSKMSNANHNDSHPQ